MQINILSVVIIIFIVIVGYFTYNKINSNDQIQSQNKQIQMISKQPILTKLNNVNKINSSKHPKSAMKKNKKNKKHRKVKFNIKEDNNKINEDLVFFDIGTSSNKYYGKIIIKLFSDIVPHTCKNFRTLCQTRKYYNSPFHRIIKDFMIQGGDFTNGNGTGGQSIYGSKFPDENFKLNHDRPYLLSSANSGPNTNGSQFFITTAEASHLDGKHVVFGEVIKGFEIVDELNEVETNGNDRPLNDIKILNCGIFV